METPHLRLVADHFVWLVVIVGGFYVGANGQPWWRALLLGSVVMIIDTLLRHWLPDRPVGGFDVASLLLVTSGIVASVAWALGLLYAARLASRSKPPQS